MTESNSMKAIQISKFGGPEVCEFVDVPIPECGDGEVLIKIDVAGINYLDNYIREGIRGNPLPFILGSEGAGTIAAIGANVSNLALGDSVVFRGSASGAYAEYATAPAWMTIRIPDGATPEAATAMHTQGITAHYLANDVFPLKDSHTCLIHAGAGGVGHQLIQVAKAKGVRVLATTGDKDKAEIAKGFGADEVILYRDTDFVEATLALTDGDGVDVVFDSVGKSTIEGSIACTKLLGTVALFGDASGITPPVETRLLANKCVKLTRVAIMPFVADNAAIQRRCDELFRLHLDGKLKLLIAPVRPLAEAAAVLTEMLGRDTRGKLLLKP